MFCLRTLREMKLLRYFNHENIISILDIQKPRSYDSFTEVYLIQVMLTHQFFMFAKSNPRNRNLWRLTCTVLFGRKIYPMTTANTLSTKHCAL